jgi:putative hydrolase of the HAD superfamily
MVEVDTLIFDIDDTLYPVSSGFSDHRNDIAVNGFMVEKLGFTSTEEAWALRNEFFQKYHSTLKALTVASEEGRLPGRFVAEELAEWWAEHCDYDRYLIPNPKLIEMIQDFHEAKLNLVCFTNSPRKYALRCLDRLGLRRFFPEDHVFTVEDVLPACKPQAAAFEQVLRSVGTVPERAVMFEDSMKNVRACAALGIRTVLIDEGRGGGEAALLGDTPCALDPAVDVVVRSIEEVRDTLPGLIEGRFVPPCK